MSIFYDLLKKKANNSETKNEVAAIGEMHFNQDVNYFSMTYQELLKKVDEYIEMFKDPKNVHQPITW